MLSNKLEHTQQFICHHRYFERFLNHFFVSKVMYHMYNPHTSCVCFLESWWRRASFKLQALSLMNAQHGTWKNETFLTHYPKPSHYLHTPPHCQHAFNVTSKEDLGFTSHVRELGKVFWGSFCTLGFIDGALSCCLLSWRTCSHTHWVLCKQLVSLLTIWCAIFILLCLLWEKYHQPNFFLVCKFFEYGEISLWTSKLFN